MFCIFKVHRCLTWIQLMAGQSSSVVFNRTAAQHSPAAPQNTKDKKLKPDMIQPEALKSVREGGGDFSGGQVAGAVRETEEEEKHPLKRGRLPCGRSAERGWCDV